MELSENAKEIASKASPFSLAPFGFRAEALPGLTDLELQLRLGAFSTESLFATKDGKKIPGKALSTDGLSIDWQLTRRVLSGGASLVFLGLQNRFAQLRQLALDTKHFAGGSVHINAYLTPKGAQALPAHEDPYSVYVFQVAGKKQWNLGETPSSLVTLSGGDVLFMRKGTKHEAHTADIASLHYTVAMDESTSSTRRADDVSLPEVLGLE